MSGGGLRGLVAKSRGFGPGDPHAAIILTALSLRGCLVSLAGPQIQPWGPSPHLTLSQSTHAAHTADPKLGTGRNPQNSPSMSDTNDPQINRCLSLFQKGLDTVAQGTNIS